MTTYRKVQTVSLAVFCTMVLMFSACNKKASNPLDDSCGDIHALNYVAGGVNSAKCQYAISRYSGQYSIVDTHIYADYYGTAEDRWDTAFRTGIVTVSVLNSNTLKFDGALSLLGYDSSNGTTTNTNYDDSLSYRHSSGYSRSYNGYNTAWANINARGVFRHDSLFFKHENMGSTITDNFKHLGYGVKVN